MGMIDFLSGKFDKCLLVKLPTKNRSHLPSFSILAISIPGDCFGYTDGVGVQNRRSGPLMVPRRRHRCHSMTETRY